MLGSLNSKYFRVFSNKRRRILADKMNRYVEMESPCLQPLIFEIGLNKLPHCNTEPCISVLKSFFQYIEIFIKPEKSSTFQSNFRDRESKAFAKSVYTDKPGKWLVSDMIPTRDVPEHFTKIP